MLQHTARERNIKEQTTIHTTTAAPIPEQRDTQNSNRRVNRKERELERTIAHKDSD